MVLGVLAQELSVFQQQLTLGRQRLETFAGQFRPTAANDLASNSATVPLGGADLCGEEDERPETEGAGLSPELLFRFDRSFQTEVLERRGGMRPVRAKRIRRCGGPTPPRRPAKRSRKTC